MPVENDADVDATILEFVHWRFLAGYEPNDGSKLLAAWGSAFPQFAKGGTRTLVRSPRAVKGWRRLMPAESPVAPGWPVIAAIACLMERELAWAGTAIIVAHDAYLRPSELMSLRIQDVVLPDQTIPGSPAWASLVIRAQAWEVPTKVGGL